MYAAAVLISNFFLFCLDTASIKFVNSTTQPQQMRKVISTTAYLFVTFLIIVSGILCASGNIFTHLFGFDRSYLGWILLFGSTFALRNFGDAIIRSLHLFRYQSFVRVGEAALVMLVFLLLYYGFGDRGFDIYVLSLVSGYLLYGLFFLGKTYRNFTRIKREDVVKIIPYAAFSFFGGISGLLLAYSDKILIGKYIGIGELGVYNAYYTVSVTVMSQLAVMFINVFFPIIAGREQKIAIYKKVSKALKYAFLPAFLFIAIGLFVALKLFGNQYPISFLNITLFSVYAYLYICFVIFWWILGAAGVRGMRFTSVISMVSVFIFYALFFSFKDEASVQLILIFLGVAMTFNILMANKYHEKILQR